MEEVVAAEAGGTRLPAKASRRRPGGRPWESEVAGDNWPGAAGEGGNRPAAADSNLHRGEEDLAAQQDDAAGDPDERYMDKEWTSLMLWSLFLMLAKARPLTHPPAWVSRAWKAAGGEHQVEARVYFSLWALSFGQELAIVAMLCLFKQKLVSAGRARTTVRLFMKVALPSTVPVLAVVVSVTAGPDENWVDAVAAFLMVAPAAAAAVLFVVRKVGELVADVGRLFRG